MRTFYNWMHRHDVVAGNPAQAVGTPKLERHLPGAPPELVPDVVILTEGTGDSKKGALGIYRGQRGRMQIEVEVTGRSCHGSMPWEGLNPLEYGGAIVKEAASARRADFTSRVAR